MFVAEKVLILLVISLTVDLNDTIFRMFFYNVLSHLLQRDLNLSIETMVSFDIWDIWVKPPLPRQNITKQHMNSKDCYTVL